MIPVGTIKSLHRYPVKSMAGEDLASAELGWHGIKDDRRYAFIRNVWLQRREYQVRDGNVDEPAFEDEPPAAQPAVTPAP